jgi:hypothetical protein
MPMITPRLVWTSRHVALVRRHRGQGCPEPLTCPEVALLLGPPWTAKRVRSLARHLGLCRPQSRWTPGDDERLRRLNRRGHSDQEAARLMGRDYYHVLTRRRRLGLPPARGRHPPTPAGDRSPARVGARLKALLSPWPAAATPAEARLLSVLDSCGAAGPSGPFLPGWCVACLLGVCWTASGGSPHGLRRRVRRMAARGVLEACRSSGRSRRLLVRVAAGVCDRAGRPAGTGRDES